MASEIYNLVDMLKVEVKELRGYIVTNDLEAHKSIKHCKELVDKIEILLEEIK